jgi:DNA-binding transcriptional LysR family regulator
MIRELKTLIAVAQEGTFAAAGEKIGLSQAAVSAQMQRLENRLGFALFDRKGRTSRLTRKGQQVLAQAQQLVGLYENLGASPSGGKPDTLINIGAIASVQRSLLPDTLSRFQRQYPACHTRVLPGVTMDLINLVDSGEVVMAAVLRPPFSLQGDVQAVTLMQEPFRLIVPRSVKSNDWAGLLRTHAFVRYDRASFGGRQVDRFLQRMHCSPKDVCEMDELEAIVSLVAKGLGVALVPQTAAYRRWPAGVRAIDLAQHTFHREVVLVHRAERNMSEPARALAGLLRDTASRQHPA